MARTIMVLPLDALKETHDRQSADDQLAENINLLPPHTNGKIGN